MADALPPLEPFPEDSSPSSSNLRRSAEWAATFGGSGTNLAQRRRHNQDIIAYTQARQREQAQMQANELATNKVAQDLYFKSQELERKRTNDQFALQERQMRMQHAQELHPLALEAKRTAASAAMARENALVRKDRLSALIEKRKAEDTDGFQSELLTGIESGNLRPGTPEFLRATAAARLKYPSVDTALFDDLMKTIGLTPDEVLKKAEELKAAGVTATVSTTGNVSVSTKPQPPADMGTERITIDEKGDVSGRTISRPIQPMPGSAPAGAIGAAAGASPQAQPVSTPVDPRLNLARKALNDPNASEAHKAAARRILGE